MSDAVLRSMLSTSFPGHLEEVSRSECGLLFVNFANFPQASKLDLTMVFDMNPTPLPTAHPTTLPTEG